MTIYAILGGFAVAVAAIFKAFLVGKESERKKRDAQDAEARIETIQKREELANEAHQLDDTSLADRITRD